MQQLWTNAVAEQCTCNSSLLQPNKWLICKADSFSGTSWWCVLWWDFFSPTAKKQQQQCFHPKICLVLLFQKLKIFFNHLPLPGSKEGILILLKNWLDPHTYPFPRIQRVFKTACQASPMMGAFPATTKGQQGQKHCNRHGNEKKEVE